MLFTDCPAITIEDLADYETSILDTAATEGIDLTVKIRLATNEVGIQLKAQFAPLAVTGLAGGPGLTLENIVVTPPMLPWLVYHTLELVYRDAYFSQLNDRYKAKWDQYTTLSLSASALLSQIGIGTTANPVPQAENPSLSLVAGSLAPGKYFVAVTWLDAGGEEGAPSEATARDVPSGDTLQVQPVNPPANAVSWKLYAGVTPDCLYLQNSTPFALTVSWVAPNSGVITTGPKPGHGQQPEFMSPAPRILLRG